MFPQHFRADEERQLYPCRARCRGPMGRHLLKLGARVPAYQYLSARTRSTRTARIRLQQRLHAARSAERHRRRVRQAASRRSCSGCRPSGSVAATATQRTEQYRYYDVYRAGRLEARLAADAEPRAALGLPAAGDGEGQPDGLGVRSDDRRTRSSRSCRGAARSTRRPDSRTGRCSGGSAVREPRRTGDAVQERLEQHPAARRRHLQASPTGSVARANYGRSYLGLSSGGCRPASTRRTSSRRRRSSRPRRTASIPGRRGQPVPRRRSSQPLAGELGLLTGIGTGLHDSESRLRDPVHGSVDGGRRRPAAVEDRPRRRVRRATRSASSASAATSTSSRVGERQGDPPPRRQHRLPESDVPQPVRRTVPGTRAQRRDAGADRAAAPESAFQGDHDEPSTTSAGRLQRARSVGDQALLATA